MTMKYFYFFEAVTCSSLAHFFLLRYSVGCEKQVSGMASLIHSCMGIIERAMLRLVRTEYMKKMEAKKRWFHAAVAISTNIWPIGGGSSDLDGYYRYSVRNGPVANQTWSEAEKGPKQCGSASELWAGVDPVMNLELDLRFGGVEPSQTGPYIV